MVGLKTNAVCDGTPIAFTHPTMSIAKITGPGLTAIALSVAALWGCLISERLIVHQANLEAARALREVRMMRARKHTEPVSSPLPGLRPTLPALG